MVTVSLKSNNRSCLPQVSSKELKLLTEQLNEVYSDDNYPKNLIKYHDVPKLGRIYAIRELGKVQKHLGPVHKLRNTIFGISRPPPFTLKRLNGLTLTGKVNPQTMLRNSWTAPFSSNGVGVHLPPESKASPNHTKYNNHLNTKLFWKKGREVKIGVDRRS